MSSGSDYPGADPSDPGDPFDRPPKENPPATPEETAPIQSDQMGYWEKLAQQGQSTPPPPPPPTPPYGYYGSSAPTSTPAPAYAYGQPAYASYALPSQPNATTAMVLGLVGLIGGLLTCGLLLLVSPVAWVVGARSKRAIRDSNGQLGGESNAQAGFVMGIIGTVLLVLGIIALVLIVIALFSFGSSGSVSTGIQA